MATEVWPQNGSGLVACAVGELSPPAVRAEIGWWIGEYESFSHEPISEFKLLSALRIPAPEGPEVARFRQNARQSSIHRDEWNIPSIMLRQAVTKLF